MKWKQDAKRFWERPIGERPKHDGYAITGDLRLTDADRFWGGRIGAQHGVCGYAIADGLSLADAKKIVALTMIGAVRAASAFSVRNRERFWQ